tara:strand:- start:72625 stop:74085 length:1461 start_codon:yes stop_codon:yes gene_type:complete
MNLKIFLTVITIILLLPFHFAEAQHRTSIESSAILSSSSATPFWFQSNRNGVYTPDGNQILLRIQSYHSYDLSSSIKTELGADLVARPDPGSTLYFNQGFIKLKGYGFELAAGRFNNSSPTNDDTLSMGSLGVSRNAIPIPQIRFGLSDWTDLPLTNGFIEVKGHLAHGWLGGQRYIDNTLLHEKMGHIRFGGDASFKPYVGLAHYAKWSGTEPNGREVPARFKDFLSVFFAVGGDERTPGPDQTYVLGNHLGAIDAGFYFSRNEYELLVYRQFPFELKTNLLFKSYMDALTGISIDFPDRVTFLDQFLYEFLYTKYQAGPRELRDDREPDSRGDYRYNENYYNHFFYRSGWTYNKRVIGSPLFTVNEDNLGIFNNRIVAHHVAFISSIESLKITGRATFSRNYGKRCDNRVPDLGEKELFGIECVNVVENVGGRSLDQWSLQFGIESPIPINGKRNLHGFAEFAFDSGKLAGSQVGTLIGFRWEL